MEITVRNAAPDDYSSVCELFDEIDALHRDNLPDRFQKPVGPAREPGYYSALIADENTALLVAEADGKLLGFVHAFVKEAPAEPIFVPRRYAIIDSIVVRAGFQDHGIGRRLMEKAQAWAIARGAISMELNVYEFNESAISFYEGLGYQAFSRKMSKDLRRSRPA